MNQNALVEQVDAILPQTQCTQCGYNGCLPYAQAIVTEHAPINRCPPGGDACIEALSRLLNRAVTALDTNCGQPEPLQVAQIDEAHCIGCTLCIQACPTDAIVGASKLMHTVLPDSCTGCKLCVAPCPVDCINMVPAEREWTAEDADKARANTRRREARLKRKHPEDQPLAARTLSNKAALTASANNDAEARKKTIADALARARARRRGETA